jgi:YgiT-type zinc finger domain-containing protein
MACLICDAPELFDGLTSVTFERGEIRLAIEGVPARVCPNCGDAVVAEDVAVLLLHAADQMSAAGLIEGRQDFQALLSKKDT